eukprot:3329101-Pleurochrysis_carterae.AAC.1
MGGSAVRGGGTADGEPGRRTDATAALPGDGRRGRAHMHDGRHPAALTAWAATPSRRTHRGRCGSCQSGGQR